jgi:hypothetical protein
MTMQQYDGTVWCLEVPTGAYVVRRNGQVAMCGNSRHWAGKSDAGFALWRPHPYGPTYCNVAKLKNNEIWGRPDLLQFQHDFRTNTFSVAARGMSLLEDISSNMKDGTWDHLRTHKVEPKEPRKFDVVYGAMK